MKKKFFILGMAAAVLVAVFLIFAVIYPAIPMKGVEWKEKELSYTNEFGNLITVRLIGKKVLVLKDKNLIWESPTEYKVQDVLIADIDKDSREIMNPEKRFRENEEIILLLWKKGRFGQHKPFWIEKNPEKNTYTQHIFIYNIVPHGMRSKWGSSYMGMVAREIRYDDGILKVQETDNQLTFWKWDSWGFVKQ